MSGITEAFKIEWPLLLAQLVNFLLLLALLYMFMYKPVLNMLAKRKERMAQSTKDAERVSAAAQEAEQDKVRVLDVARREAQETLIEVKKAMGLTGIWNKIRRSDEKRTKEMAKMGE